MTTTIRIVSYLLAVPLALSVGACGDDGDPGSTGGGGTAPSACKSLPDDCEGRAARALDANAAALDATATALGEQMATACRDAAVHFGVDPGTIPAAATLEERLAWCDRASTAIAGTTPAVAVDTLCAIDLAAQAACESACEGAESGCTPDVFKVPESRCGQDLSGTCQGQCAGACWPDPGSTVDCNGACVGTCTGTCDGAPSSGPCEGSCAGSCDGPCDAGPGGMASCQGTCVGACDIAWIDPSCTDTVTSAGPGQCITCGRCNTECAARGSFGVTCRAAAAVTGPPPADAAVLRVLFEAAAATGASVDEVLDGVEALLVGAGGSWSSQQAWDCVQEASTRLNASARLLTKIADAAAVVLQL